MIRLTDTLNCVARSKSFTDAEFRALFLYALGDRDKPLSRKLEPVAEIIADDQSRLVKSYDDKIAEIRERRKQYRERKAAQKE